MIDLASIQPILTPLQPQLIYLFGSQVTGRLHPDSDIDLAILAGCPQNAYQLFMVAQQLADQLHHEVDLVDLATASAVMKAEIVTRGQLLFALNPDLAAEFEMYTLSMYAQANQDRREVLLNYGVNLDD